MAYWKCWRLGADEAHLINLQKSINHLIVNIFILKSIKTLSQTNDLNTNMGP